MGHVRLKINDQVVTAEVIDQQSTISRNTGKGLFQVEVRFRVHEDQRNFCTEVLQNGNVTLLSPDGDSSTDIPVRVHEKQHSFTVGDPIQRCTWVLSEVEQLNLEALQIGDLTLSPYRYTDEFSEDALVCNFCIDVDAATYKCIRSLPQYFPVVRKGVSDTPRAMRFGPVVWATEDEQTYRLRATLVEQNYDKPGAGNDILQPEFRNVLDELSVTTIRISRILDMLESKGLLTGEEKKTIREVAEEEKNERRSQFSRVKDFDKWIANED